MLTINTEDYTKPMWILLFSYLYRLCSNCETKKFVETLGSSKLDNQILEHAAFCDPVKYRSLVNTM